MSTAIEWVPGFARRACSSSTSAFALIVLWPSSLVVVETMAAGGAGRDYLRGEQARRIRRRRMRDMDRRAHLAINRTISRISGSLRLRLGMVDSYFAGSLKKASRVLSVHLLPFLFLRPSE